MADELKQEKVKQHKKHSHIVFEFFISKMGKGRKHPKRVKGAQRGSPKPLGSQVIHDGVNYKIGKTVINLGFDVAICGRGGYVNTVNSFLKVLAERIYIPKYTSAKSNREKQQILGEFMNHVLKRGGRFLVGSGESATEKTVRGKLRSLVAGKKRQNSATRSWFQPKSSKTNKKRSDALWEKASATDDTSCMREDYEQDETLESFSPQLELDITDNTSLDFDVGSMGSFDSMDITFDDALFPL